jgi:Zn-dependent peptidase ImmA (M78 family)
MTSGSPLVIDRSFVRQMVRAGASQRKIAAACGCSYEAIRRRLLRWGLTTRYKSRHRELVERQAASRAKPHYEPTEAKREGELPAAWAVVSFADVGAALLCLEERDPAWWRRPTREAWTRHGSSAAYAAAF